MDSCFLPYIPPWFLQNGVAMTIYTHRWANRDWEQTIEHPQPDYQATIFSGAEDVPIFGLVAIPENAHSTIIATYGITGDLETEWFLQILGRKAYAQGYAVVLFDWRAHGRTADLSPTLTSDGLYEGEDFVRIAAKAKSMGCPSKFWFAGFSLGGQLALWGIKAAQELIRDNPDLGLEKDDIGGATVICPSLDSNRSLTYLVNHPVGKYLEKAIARKLKTLAWRIHDAHPGNFDSQAIERASSIWGFDHELVIERLGFPSVEAYYEASSALYLLPNLAKPVLMIYAADDPFFHPDIISDLKLACSKNPAINLLLTKYGGHVGYFSSQKCQMEAEDTDPWWAWNRILQWLENRR
jgi:predicted alpha/beta-fold hydrolase